MENTISHAGLFIKWLPQHHTALPWTRWIYPQIFWGSWSNFTIQHCNCMVIGNCKSSRNMVSIFSIITKTGHKMHYPSFSLVMMCSHPATMLLLRCKVKCNQLPSPLSFPYHVPHCVLESHHQTISLECKRCISSNTTSPKTYTDSEILFSRAFPNCICHFTTVHLCFSFEKLSINPTFSDMMIYCSRAQQPTCSQYVYSL